MITLSYDDIVGAITRTDYRSYTGSGPIFLHDVMCTGSEFRLLDCPNEGLERSSCSHYNDAGVRCLTG